ncbi:MAG TPA: DUF805 domain-containing protein [Mesorhizobium sp.]|jgi:uncharacterized membrane protein YhaH (DUF805 family)|nr:DUF805 domain-containing protein [Mesorhizobium sp.]
MGGYGTVMRANGAPVGRASRSEFWQFNVVLFALISAIVFLLGAGPGASVWPNLLLAIVVLVHIGPWFNVMGRRLHDINWSAWWALLAFVPYVFLLLFVSACFPGTRGPNRFGPDPLGSAVGGELPASHRSTQGRVEPSFGAPAQPVEGRDSIAQFEKLAQLRASGALSDLEFEVLKARLFSERRTS